MHIAVQVPAYMEGWDMVDTLDSITDQSIPARDTVEREVWVTPADDGETWAAAEDAPGWDVYEAPRGKLSARNDAHDSAVMRGADVVVSWDADAPATDDRVLSRLVQPYDDLSTVATNGWYTHDGPLGFAHDFAAQVDYWVMRPIYGRISSLSAHGWMEAGPFDESVAQTDLIDIRQEEEFDFRHRLEDVGEVVDVRDAVVYGDDRRYNCWYDRLIPGREPSEWCEERGGNSFAPAENRR